MKIQIFSLCDFAQNNNGKLTIIGTFNKIFADHFPYLYPPAIHVVAKVVTDEAYTGEFTFSAFKPNGEVFLGPLSGSVVINNPTNDNREKSFDFNIALNSLVFETPGTYTFKFVIGNLEAIQELYIEDKSIAVE